MRTKAIKVKILKWLILYSFPSLIFFLYFLVTIKFACCMLTSYSIMLIQLWYLYVTNSFLFIFFRLNTNYMYLPVDMNDVKTLCMLRSIFLEDTLSKFNLIGTHSTWNTNCSATQHISCYRAKEEKSFNVFTIIMN